MQLSYVSKCLVVKTGWNWIYYEVFTVVCITIFLFWQVFFRLSLKINKVNNLVQQKLPKNRTRSHISLLSQVSCV